ncbi:DnaB-like dsDNA helicase [Gordonia phage LitninMcQueen]
MNDFSDPAAEATVLAAFLAQPSLSPVAVNLDQATFTTPVHRLVCDAIQATVRARDPLDHANVSRRAAQAAATRGQASMVTQTVMGMIGKGDDYSVGFYLDRLTALHKARQTHETVQRLGQMVEESIRLDDNTIIDAGIARAVEDLNGLSGGDQPTADDLPMSLDELLEKKHTHNWLIPELLEVTDRLVLTGFEGTGKSFLIAQMVMAVAAGLHPFLGVQVADPVQTLVIDAENSERQTSRRYRRLRTIIDKQCANIGIDPPDWAKLVRFVIRPEGIALNDPRTVRSIEKAIAATQPKFVAMGPLYRLHRLDTRDEQAAKELTDAIDRLRVKYQFALVAEAHVAHGAPGAQRALRPTGSSLFLRWPEFGFGLRPAQGTENQQHPDRVDLVAWRGGREERLWPSQLQHSVTMPWGNADPDYYDNARRVGLI